MSAAKIKGSLLEYIVRRILTNCGFTKVEADGRYIFNDRGLNFIHGKGAAHDADVLMNPPIQMPFSYPFRINFECKAFNKKTGLTIVRNALGLRYDINEFEVLTVEQLDSRRNLRRLNFAISDRVRYNYQVGVASVENFTKDAFEFAANNKIPLISLRWIFSDDICNLFHELTDNYLSNIYTYDEQKELLLFLKGDDDKNYKFTYGIHGHISTILRSLEEFESKIIIGLLESGDMIFLFSEENINREYFLNSGNLNARYTYYSNELNLWNIIINNDLELKFYLPEKIVNLWRTENFEAIAAINIKERLFSKLFLFPGHPTFKIVNIDQDWLNNVR